MSRQVWQTLIVIAALAAGCTSARPAPPVITGAPEIELSESAVRVVADGFRIPWGLGFLPDGSALMTERGNAVPSDDQKTAEDTSGAVARILRITPDGKVSEVQHLPQVDRRLGEGGLLGLAVSPDYATDGWVYIYYSAENDNRIARLRLGESPKPILTGIPVRSDVDGSRYHQGGRLAFGPDGMLYASVGETYLTPDMAQDRDALGGKILRITPEGKPAPGNPFPNSPVWSYGHRNVQGMAWDAQGRMYASEFGYHDVDELNLIEPGHNYGWPEAEGNSDNPEFTNPIATWNPTSIASPSGIAVLGEHVYLACLAGQTLYRVNLDGSDQRRLLDHRYGRFRTIVADPSGGLWVTTSNLDRGGREAGIEVGPEGDRILRITPE